MSLQAKCGQCARTLTASDPATTAQYIACPDPDCDGRGYIDRRLQITVRTMNPGQSNEFQRVFFTCPNGHDLGSVPLDLLDGHRIETDCDHYQHRRAS